ncbi:MAG: glycosyltransferase [Deltaproteobacteria bacterium]|jgi:tetratricopeptide (TPR) repeat protein|nr:glycosyltransferase [Deltaproteobacteria bacterium]
MLILSLGSDYFHDAFQKLGHSVLVPPHQEGFPLESLYNNLSDRPDLIVFTDNIGRHAWPEGLSKIYGIPKIYYAVDTPINFWWQKNYAQLFDHVFVDQLPYVSQLEALGIPATWLPVGVDTKSYLPQNKEEPEKLYDFGFVGVIDSQVRPKRDRLVNLISQHYTLKTMGGRESDWVGPDESSTIYRQSKLALNENLFPGVTMRMLEAMASGAVLFTEKAGGDLGEIFKPGEDFAWFEPHELLETAKLWLADKNLRKKTAKRALEKVEASHDIFNRAETLLTKIKNVHLDYAKKDEAAWDWEAKTLFLTALRWHKQDGQARLLRSEKLFRTAFSSSRISPEGLFMLGHIQRLKRNLDEAIHFLTLAYEAGEPRGALGLGIFNLGLQKPLEASQWLGKFTNITDFPALTMDTLHFEAVKLIAKRLMEIGEDLSPGFSRAPHDPALWTAFEYYLTVFNAVPGDLEITHNLLKILLKYGCMAEALDVTQKALEYNPEDDFLNSVFCEAGRASYLSIN